MAEMGWTAQVAAAAGVAAGTGAAQLGLGYGLGVVEWPAVPAADSVWLGSLGWATWIAASSTVFGAVIADRLGRAVGGAWRFALAISAAVGALLTVALIALPARAAVRTDTFAPQTIAAGYAVIGVLLGLVIAYWAVVSRPVAANLIATAVWLWSLAVAAVMTTIFWQRPSATYLSSWQFVSPDTADYQYGIIFWPSALLTLLAAFVVGIIGALPAVRRGDLGVGAASSGAVGPLLVAAAFFVLAPQLTGTPGPLQSAYLIAPYAVLAGLAGSALVVALGQRQARRRTDAVVSPGEQAELGSGPRRAGAVSAGSGAARKGSADSATGAADKAEGPGSASAVVPAPRQAPAAKPEARARAEAASPGTAKPAGQAAVAAVAAEPRPRKSFMDRFRGKNTGQDSEPAAVATGRAKAPSPASASAPGATRSPASDAAAGPASGRGKSPAARPGSGAASARSGAPSVDGAARPAASSAPGRSDSRSTVAPPPTSPPIAKINDPRSGEKPPAPPKSPARPSGNPPPGPANAVGSDKSPPARKTAAKSAKATPPAAGARPASPKQANPGRPAGGRATPSSPADAARRAEDADTAELPNVRRPGEDETR